jgi:hypothetical protein
LGDLTLQISADVNSCQQSKLVTSRRLRLSCAASDVSSESATSGAAVSLAGAGAAAAGLDSNDADDDCAAARASAGAELGATSGVSFCSSAAVASTTYLARASLKQWQPLVGWKTEAGARTGKTQGSGGR